MFTGIIEKTGCIEFIKTKDSGLRLAVNADFTALKAGESIAVDGVCLTLTSFEKDKLFFDISPETLKLTTFKHLQAGDIVNIERSMLSDSRFGGHYVSGHVDTTAKLSHLRKINEFIELKVAGFNVKDQIYLIPKGSITINGVSLTINTVVENAIYLMLVPHTMSVTNLSNIRVGSYLNIEFDYLARTIAHQLQQLTNLKSEVSL